MRTILLAWFLCRVLGWHKWEDLDEQINEVYSHNTKLSETADAIPLYRQTMFLQQCSQCKLWRSLEVRGAFSGGDDDGDDPDDQPTPSPEELEKLITIRSN